MWRLFKAVGAMLAVMAITLGYSGGALAGGGTGQNMVTKTFKLTIYGTPPSTDAFAIGYVKQGQDPNKEGKFVALCVDTSKLSKQQLRGLKAVSDQPCVGNGNSYTYQVQFPQGTHLAFFFARLSVTDQKPFQVFYTSVKDPSRIESNKPPRPEDFETLNGDTTNSAWFRYSNAGTQPTKMPNTGAGGMARTDLPLGAAAAAALLLTGGYALRRRLA